MKLIEVYLTNTPDRKEGPREVRNLVNAQNLVDNIIKYESGELPNAGMLNLFSYLLKTGQAWTLQGHYGRTAQALIDNGYLNRKGKILQQV